MAKKLRPLYRYTHVCEWSRATSPSTAQSHVVLHVYTNKSQIAPPLHSTKSRHRLPCQISGHHHHRLTGGRESDSFSTASAWGKEEGSRRRNLSWKTRKPAVGFLPETKETCLRFFWALTLQILQPEQSKDQSDKTPPASFVDIVEGGQRGQPSERLLERKNTQKRAHLAMSCDLGVNFGVRIGYFKNCPIWISPTFRGLCVVADFPKRCPRRYDI